jgi:hypothetical protein
VLKNQDYLLACHLHIITGAGDKNEDQKDAYAQPLYRKSDFANHDIHRRHYILYFAERYGDPLYVTTYLAWIYSDPWLVVYLYDHHARPSRSKSPRVYGH